MSQYDKNPILIIAILGLVNLVNQMDRVLFSLMVEPIKTELQLSDSEMGLLGGFAFALSFAFLGLVAGRIADSWNRVHLMGFALTLWSAATAACGLAYGFGQMFISRMLVGTGEAGCVPAAQSLIADHAHPKNRAFLISLFTGIGTVGTLIGLVLGGIVMQLVGWRMTFVAFGLFGVVPLIVLLVFLRDPRQTPVHHSASANSWGRDVRDMLKKSEILYLLIAIPLLYTLIGAATWIPAFFQRSYGITTQQFSQSGGAYLGIGLIIGTFAGGFIVRKLMTRDPRWEFWWPALSCSLAIIPLLFVYSGSSLVLGNIGLALAFFIAGTGFGPSMACMHVVSKQSVRATAVAMMIFTSSLMASGGVPAVVGILSDLFATMGINAADGTSLKYALLCSLLLPPVASILFIRVSAKVAHGSEPPAMTHNKALGSRL